MRARTLSLPVSSEAPPSLMTEETSKITLHIHISSTLYKPFYVLDVFSLSYFIEQKTLDLSDFVGVFKNFFYFLYTFFCMCLFIFLFFMPKSEACF